MTTIERADASTAQLVQPDFIRGILANTGLRMTQQRLALMDLLFARGGRHVTAESLHEELVRSGAPGSISSVYRGLKDFSDMGLLRRVPIYGSTAWFDTELKHHHHFYAVEEDRLMDVPTEGITVRNLPPLPEGYQLLSVDVLLRIRKQDHETDRKAGRLVLTERNPDAANS
ncbi:transcriptional repressor [Agrobacterium sp. S2]|nr:transcriptional repressor [Agrobacterium sp. S2]